MADRLHLVDKPESWTSHDAVARMRRILGERRVGHAGTLDPFATGLLLVAEGRATALLGALGLLPKRYRATVRLGVATDTQDRTGTPLPRASAAFPSVAAVDEALPAFRGALLQTPPLYSAVKVEGERLYKKARRGEDVERVARPIHVYALERVAADLPDVTLDLTVSRGTYVRTLAHDLGERLGCGAHLAALRRTAIGPFTVEGAGSPARDGGWDEAAFRARERTPAEAVSFLPRVRLTPEESARLRHGAPPSIGADRIERVEEPGPLPPGATGWPIALLDGAGTLLALAHPWDEQTPGLPLRLQRVLVGD
ncbi:MAG TPA: tRNA pseudouridine(55) synthase TruB [Candidatus Eisenbacteria bacterium]|nr:tRNA pseudouridine(55) synthase TruB [Candidatus Eisenbacteria bacterium]